MGRSYHFECGKCGYRAKVSGRADRGINFHVQTILCRDCKELYDAIIRLRAPDERRKGWRWGTHRLRLLSHPRAPKMPPKFEIVLNRLPVLLGDTRWVQYPLQCPVSPVHRVQSWNDPDKCPRCGIFLDKNAVPYRIWE